MGNQRLLELRERHLGLMELLRNQTRGELGAVLNVKKAGEAKNSPVEITSSDQEQVIEQDISRLVESLGLVARHVTEDQAEEDAAVNAKLEEVQSRMSAQFNVN
jgi:SHS2 domain-containing protein